MNAGGPTERITRRKNVKKNGERKKSVGSNFHHFKWMGGLGREDGNYCGQCRCEELLDNIIEVRPRIE